MVFGSVDTFSSRFDVVPALRNARPIVNNTYLEGKLFVKETYGPEGKIEKDYYLENPDKMVIHYSEDAYKELPKK